MNRDPLAALAKLIGFRGALPELPSVRQIPWKYYTIEHGPVFAYEAAGDTATCVTWMDVTVSCKHHELLPFVFFAEGADLICDLDDDISELMSPQLLDSGGVKAPKPRKSKIGAYLFELPHIWSGAIHE